MAALVPGTRVYLALGTRVGIDSGERFEWGGTKYDWIVVEDARSCGHILEDVVFTVEHVGVSHATMNGGGRDYYLRDEDGRRATVRTTFSRPESQTFELVS